MKRPEVGESLPAHDVRVTLAPMKTMAALLMDPNPIHWDTEATSALGMGDRAVNQGPLNMGYLQTMLARWSGGRDRIVDFGVRFLGNVFDGDVVTTSGTVVAVRRDDAWGEVVDCEIALDVTGGDRVLAGTATVRMMGDDQ